MRRDFDRSKPFYPIVMGYLLQLHAIKEIAALGALGSVRTWDIQKLGGNSAEQSTLQAQLNTLLGPLELMVSGEAERLTVPIQPLAKEFVENHAFLIKHQVQAALNALVMAHEVTKGKPYRTADKVWEFLRHCRNAAAHNGRWSFLNGEPRRPAEWKGIAVHSGLQGFALLRGEDGIGSLCVGDPIALLWELERDNPGMIS
jgi:hypothetical protein